MGETLTVVTGSETTLITDIAFWVISASSIIAAIAVVHFRDIFRSALFLVVSFLGVAGLFVLLRAEFLAVIQILIYVGAISVLIIFAVLMTRDVQHGNPSNRLRIPAVVLAALFVLATSFVILNTNWNLLENGVDYSTTGSGTLSAISQNANTEATVTVQEIPANTIPTLARLLLHDYVLAFEVASVLLLAAIIGALALVREGSTHASKKEHS